MGAFIWHVAHTYSETSEIRMRTLCLLLAFPMFGCATILSSSTETVDVYSDPPGATVIIDGLPVGQTPLNVDLNNHESHQFSWRRQDISLPLAVFKHPSVWAGCSSILS